MSECNDNRDKRFHLVTISADEPEQEPAAVEFLKKSGVTGAAYLRRAKDDDKFINSVDAKWSGALPALFLYDRQGTLVKSFVGETELSVIEAAILVSRLHMLPRERIEAELAYLEIAVAKTAGAHEAEAWSWLMDAIRAHYAGGEASRASRR